MPTLREQFAVLWEQLQSEWAALLVLGLTVVGGAAGSLAGPILLSHYIDAAQAGVMTGVTLAAGLYIVTATVLPVLSVVENWLATVVAWRSTNRMRVRLFRHCRDQDLELLERHPPGALITRIDGDVEMLSEFLSTFVVRLFTAALVLAGVIVVMARLDWRLGALLAFFMVLSALALNGPRSFAKRLWHAHGRASAEELGMLEELRSGTEDIRANGATAWAVARYLGRGWTSYFLRLRHEVAPSSVGPFSSKEVIVGFNQGFRPLGPTGIASCRENVLTAIRLAAEP